MNGTVRLLTPRETSTKLGITMRELRAMKAAGTAPESFDVTGRTVRYLSTSVDAYRRRQHQDSRQHPLPGILPTKGTAR